MHQQRMYEENSSARCSGGNIGTLAEVSALPGGAAIQALSRASTDEAPEFLPRSLKSDNYDFKKRYAGQISSVSKTVAESATPQLRHGPSGGDGSVAGDRSNAARFLGVFRVQPAWRGWNHRLPDKAPSRFAGLFHRNWRI